MGYLPYLGMVHDGALVLDACDQLCITVESAEALPEEERVMYQGLCKAVRAHFAPSTNGEQQKEMLPMVRVGRGGGNRWQWKRGSGSGEEREEQREIEKRSWRRIRYQGLCKAVRAHFAPLTIG